MIFDSVAIILFLLAISLKNHPDIAAVLANIPVKNLAIMFSVMGAGGSLDLYIAVTWNMVAINMILLTTIFLVYRYG